MIRLAAVLTCVYLLSACCHTQERTNGWVEPVYMTQTYLETQLPDAQNAALLRYQDQPNDENRMQLAWLLSQGEPSLQQLDHSLELTREISSDSVWAAWRNLLQERVKNMIELQNARGSLLELEAQLETKNTRLATMENRLETVEDQLKTVEDQLKAMKDIEEQMTEDIDQDHDVPK